MGRRRFSTPRNAHPLADKARDVKYFSGLANVKYTDFAYLWISLIFFYKFLVSFFLGFVP